MNYNATVISCYARGTVSAPGGGWVGGLVGQNSGMVSRSHAEGPVSAGDSVGGLVGYHEGAVSNCYSTGTVTGHEYVGGLVGQNRSTVSGSYATGFVTGTYHYVGGLVGWNYGTAIDCYATGSVTGTDYVGGLSGQNYYGRVSGCYSTGYVTGDQYVGGLSGDLNNSTVRTSYWDTETSGQTSSDGGMGRTTVQMQQQATFVGWDFASVWSLSENKYFPFLRWQGPFADAMDVGSGWSYLSWFGYFTDVGGGWLYHAEYGWLFPSGTTPASIWLWDYRMAGWLWTSSTVYPFLWSDPLQTWLYYYRGTGHGNGGWFYNYGTGQNEWR